MATPAAFIANPSVKLLSGLNKAQLLEVVRHYDLIVTSQEKSLKETLYLSVKNQLEDKGVLKKAELGVASDEASASEVQLQKPEADSEYLVLRERELALQETALKQELEIKRMQHELEMKKLELELKKTASSATTSRC